jgi:Uma2 family endonuclease
MSVPAGLRFTYEDYVLLPEDRRYEVIDGELFMTPAPTPNHQLILMRLARVLEDYARVQGEGTVLIAPCDVVLSQTDVLQPDVFFVSAERVEIIGEKYIGAAPDLVVEVLSPSTESRDRIAKAKRYAKFGVREMWLVDSKAKTIEVLVNSPEGFVRHGLCGSGQFVRSVILPALEFPVDPIF